MNRLYIVLGVTLLIYLSYRIYRLVTLDHGLNKKVENGATILDVRTETEYMLGHIEGSINIPLGTVRERYAELDIGKTYITCCSHGIRSVKAETILKEKSFRSVYNGGTWTDLKELIINDEI